MGSLIVLLSGCGSVGSGDGSAGSLDTRSNDLQLPTTEPAIYGTVTDIHNAPQSTDNREETTHFDPDTAVSSDDEATGNGDRSGDVIGVVLIEENPHEDRGSHKDSVTITKSTRLLLQQEQSLVPGSFEDFKVGERARAWYTGPVAESYPRQATARVVVIEGR